MNSLINTMLNIPDDRELDRFIFMHLSGNRQRNIRQQIIFELTGKKEPIAKCGVNKIAELLKAERAVEPKKQLKDTRGNLFHDHQDQIPARKSGNQLSMF